MRTSPRIAARWIAVRWIFGLGLLAGLAGCETLESLDFTGGKNTPPLPGERISVLALERQIEPDPRIADLEVRLPRPWANPEWPQSGGYANHVMHHLELAGDLKQVWRTSIGASGGAAKRITGSPVVADGRVFAMDAEGEVSAYDAARGSRLWRRDLTPNSEDSGAIGGGVAFDRGRLYATTAYGEVFALDPANGNVVWQQKVGVPVRGAPAVEGNRVFVITHDNQMRALEADTGKEVWAFTGIAETAGLLGGAVPAVEGGIVVAPFSSGELVALRTDNGTVAWSDALVRAARVSPVGTINDIAGSPVIDRGRVYALSHSGRMVSIDLRTGERIWEREIAGVQSPWVAGDFIFVVTLDAEVVCLSRRDGRIRWVTQLDRFRNPEAKSRKGLLTWYGPVLASGRLLLTSSHGQGVSLSPYNGDVLGKTKLSGNAAMPPVVAGETLFILTDDANLAALK